MAILPRDEQVAALVENDKGGPINMLNLLKFKDTAEYPDGRDADISGREAYDRYGIAVVEQVAKAGGEIVFAGEAGTLVVGEGDLQWDMVVIVKYPSIAAFIEMTGSDEYDEIHVHRDAGLAHQLLVQC